MSDANDGSNNGIPWDVNAPAMPYSNYAQWQTGQNFNPSVSGQNQMHDYNMYRSINQNIQGPVLGLQALFAACTRIYPDQPNPLQVTARLKYWLGGPDPLDYISMYWNTGCPDLGVPPHWHYVSFGLSDLHGDGRVHPLSPANPSQPEQISGMGLELSFRMIGEPGHPPTWPATLLQRLATYVFRTGNRLFVGDHVSWHSALDGSDDAETLNVVKLSDQASNNAASKKKTRRKLKIRHMLIAQDPQLGTLDTPLGKVQFVQIVGITDAELKVSQRSGGSVVLETLASDSRFGGPWLVTNPQRSQSVPLPQTSHSPSDLSGVAAICQWECWEPNESEIAVSANNHRSSSELPVNIKEQIKSVLQKGLSEISLHSKDSKNVENPESLSNNFATNLVIKTEIGSDVAQSETSDHNTNVCKMSTDSIKLPSNDNSLRNSILHKSYSNQRDTNMSTDSFEMSKVGAALIEDIMHLPGNIDGYNIKKESGASHPNYDIKSDFLNRPRESNDNQIDEKNITKIVGHEDVPSSDYKNANSMLDCNCQKNNEKISCTEINANTSELHNNSCNKCTIDEMWESSCVPLNGVHLIFDKEAGSLLPSALRCRVLHGRHFTWTAVNKVQAITLVATSVSGALVSPENSIVANNGWLQILISEEFAKEMAEQIEPILMNDNDDDDSDTEESQASSVLAPAPIIFTWPQQKLKISIINSI